METELRDKSYWLNKGFYNLGIVIWIGCCLENLLCKLCKNLV